MKIFEERTLLKCGYDLKNISPLGEVLFFDIETTGLKKETTGLYLMGCGYFDGEDYCIKQWLSEGALDEREILEEFAVFAGGFKTLIHFNGDGFDIPYVTYKMEYYGIDFSFDSFVSFDIYRQVKPCKKLLGLSRMGQKAIEEFLKIKRDDEMDGGRLIPYYFDYERTGSGEAERLLLLHNHDDVLGMLGLCGALSYADLYAGRFSFKSVRRLDGFLVLELALASPVPRSVEISLANGTILCADGSLFQISLPITEGDVKVPVADYKNYYYLTEEDTVIHKDLGRFVEARYRKQAKAETAWARVPEDVFLSQNAAYFERCARATVTLI